MECFKHVFLIPSDGELGPTEGGLHTAAWDECTNGDGSSGSNCSTNTGTSSSSSSTLAAAAAAAAVVSCRVGEEANEQRLLCGGVQSATEQVAAAAAAAAAAAVAAATGEGGPLACRGSEKALAGDAARSRRLPDVEELLLSRPAGVQQVQQQVQQQPQQEVLLEQLLQQTTEQQSQHGHKAEGQQTFGAGVLSRNGSAQQHGGGRRGHGDGTGSSKHSSGRGR
ncbi:hypothetical protein, conserved [Eimeria praecox]|uniref:Uncharacterized protein n=1 Tax=Eimeria praecox TaxID=51316 RepID=U6G617_9EIME|nr:hypothetical protein, conserved [Eimeria praecox]